MKNRIFSLLLVLSLIASAFCFVVNAEGNYDATVTSAKAVYDPDGQKISYSLEYTGGALMEAVMNLDKTNNSNNVLFKITVVGVKNGTDLANGVQVALHTVAAHSAKGEGKTFSGEYALAKSKFNSYETVYFCISTNVITGSNSYSFENLAIKVALKGEEIVPPPVDGVPCQITLVPGASSVKVGDTVTLKVSVKDVDTAVAVRGIVAVSAPIVWDSSVLKFESYSDTVIPEGWDTFHNETAVSNGRFEIHMCDDTGDGLFCTEDGFFEITLKFKALKAGTCEFKAERISVADDEVIEFFIDAEPVSVSVSATPVSTELVLGDVNGDGGVDSLDAAKILQYDAGLVLLTAKALERADVNKDGGVDALDASKVLQYDADIISRF